SRRGWQASAPKAEDYEAVGMASHTSTRGIAFRIDASPCDSHCATRSWTCPRNGQIIAPQPVRGISSQRWEEGRPTLDKPPPRALDCACRYRSMPPVSHPVNPREWFQPCQNPRMSVARCRLVHPWRGQALQTDCPDAGRHEKIRLQKFA